MENKRLYIYTYVDGVNDLTFPQKSVIMDNRESNFFTSEEKKIITKEGDTFWARLDVEQIYIDEYTYTAQRMGNVTLNATLMNERCLDSLWSGNEYVMFKGEKYFIRQTPTSSKDNTDERYKHELNFVSERSVLDSVYFYDVVTDNTSVDRYASNSTKVTFYGDIHEFVARLNDSMEYSGVEYSIEIDDGVTSDAMQISLEDTFISNALQEIFNQYELAYYFVGKVIHVGFTSNAIPTPFKYGAENNLLSITKTNANYKIVTRCTGVGSSDNIPYYYPNESDDRKAIEDNGGTWITPSETLMPSIYRTSNGTERFYDAIDQEYKSPETGEYYVFENTSVPGNPMEHKVTFEDIKPTIKGMTNANQQLLGEIADIAFDKEDNDEIDDEGNYIHPYFFIKLHKFDGTNGFNLFDHSIDEAEMTISMTSGTCGACEFTIGVDDETQKNLVQVDKDGALKRDSDGNVVRSGVPQDKQNDTMNNEVWIALKKDIDTFGVVMPNHAFSYAPSKGDTFVILHIDLPQAYITAAEKKLDEQIIDYMANNNSEKFNFSLNFSRIYLANNPELADKIDENARLLVDYDNKQYTLYVSTYTYKVSANEALPEINVELTDTITVNKSSLLTTIDAVKADIMNSIGSIDFYKQGLKYFLRKDTDDMARGNVTFCKNINVKGKSVSEGGTQFGKSYASGMSGFGGFINGSGNAELESLTLRRFLEVPEYRYNRVDIKVGDKWRAAGGGIIESVDTDNHIATLKLEDGEIGAIAADDICMGIFHSNNESENAVRDYDDGQGNRMFAGFYTCYFRILSVEDDHKTFQYELRPTNSASENWKFAYEPQTSMTFVAYGNFSNKERQTSVYETRTYTRMLKDQNTWEISENNVALQYGDMTNMSIWGLDMSGYSMYLKNIYVKGTFKQVKDNGDPITQMEFLSSYKAGQKVEFYNAVSYGGSSWVCVNVKGTNSVPSATDTSNWMMLAEKGKNGTNGTDGKDGKDGKNGADSTSYWMIVTPDIVHKIKENGETSLDTQVITITRMAQTGTEEATAVDYGSLTYESSDLEVDDASEGVYVNSSWSYVDITWTTTDGTQVDIQRVPIVSDGDKGAQGIQGCVLRDSEWKEGTAYLNESNSTGDGVRYIDIVLQESSSAASGWDAWMCVKSHTATADNMPKVDTATEYWEPFSQNTLSVFTSLIIAKNAKIKFLQGNQLILMDADGNIVGGMSGFSTDSNDIRIWVGSDVPSDAPFQVLEDGTTIANKLQASGAVIDGEITATSGKIAGMRIKGSGLSNESENNDASIFLKNNDYGSVAAIGGNVLPTSGSIRGVAWFQNNDPTKRPIIGDYNYCSYFSAQSLAMVNRAIEIDGGDVSGFAMHNSIISVTKTLVRNDYHCLFINNSSEIIITLPQMQTYDDGHVIRVRRLGSKKVTIKAGHSYVFDTSSSPINTKLVNTIILYGEGRQASSLSMSTVGESWEFVWSRDVTDVGAWIWYKFQRGL